MKKTHKCAPLTEAREAGERLYTCWRSSNRKVRGAVVGTKEEVLAWMTRRFPDLRKAVYEDGWTSAAGLFYHGGEITEYEIGKGKTVYLVQLPSKRYVGKTVVARKPFPIHYSACYMAPHTGGGTVETRPGLRFKITEEYKDGDCGCVALDSEFNDEVLEIEVRKFRSRMPHMRRCSAAISGFRLPTNAIEDGLVEIVGRAGSRRYTRRKVGGGVNIVKST